MPKRIRSALDNAVVVQVACGEIHSLALTQKGQVYGWGYTEQGQLGLGLVDPSVSCQMSEPTLIEGLASVRITEVFSGATFSMFLSDKKELYACGLNDSNQLGIEKNIAKVSNHLDRFAPASSKIMESDLPKKLECFTSMPVLKVASGEAHSLAVIIIVLLI